MGIKISKESLDNFKKEKEQFNAPEVKTMYGEQIKALQKAIELCEKGGCKNAIPIITQRISWMRENNYELYPNWCFS